jgi:hypothetical protein
MLPADRPVWVRQARYGPPERLLLADARRRQPGQLEAALARPVQSDGALADTSSTGFGIFFNFSLNIFLTKKSKEKKN